MQTLSMRLSELKAETVQRVPHLHPTVAVLIPAAALIQICHTNKNSRTASYREHLSEPPLHEKEKQETLYHMDSVYNILFSIRLKISFFV